MCGGCGGAPPDQYGDLVAGPLRRALVARTVGRSVPALAVRAVPGGWTVSRPTGGATVCRTLDGLLDAVQGHAVVGPADLRSRVLAALATG
jgi:hypothetical protein